MNKTLKELYNELTILYQFRDFLDNNNLDFFACSCCDNLSFYYRGERYPFISCLCNYRDLLFEIRKREDEVKKIKGSDSNE